MSFDWNVLITESVGSAIGFAFALLLFLLIEKIKNRPHFIIELTKYDKDDRMIEINITNNGSSIGYINKIACHVNNSAIPSIPHHLVHRVIQFKHTFIHSNESVNYSIPTQYIINRTKLVGQFNKFIIVANISNKIVKSNEIEI